MILFIMRGWRWFHLFCLRMKPKCVTTQVKAILHNFHAVLFVKPRQTILASNLLATLVYLRVRVARPCMHIC